MKSFLIILTLSSLLNADTFRKDGTVIDTKNNLQWVNSGEIIEFQSIWRSANSYCESSSYLGYHDWSLPSVKEMKTLVEIYNNSKLLNLDDSVYWTSELDEEEFNTYAFEVYIGNGHTSSADKCDKERFLCVRHMQ